MAEGLNRWQGFGALGADPDLKELPNGGALMKFRMACADKYKSRSGEWLERTEWVRCVMFGKRAEKLAAMLGKGSKVYVEGSLRTSSWEKDGQKHYSTEVHVDQLFLASAKRESSRRSSRGDDWDEDDSKSRKRDDDDFDEPPERGSSSAKSDDIPF